MQKVLMFFLCIISLYTCSNDPDPIEKNTTPSTINPISLIVNDLHAGRLKNNNIQLKWTSTGAADYRIYRYTALDKVNPHIIDYNDSAPGITKSILFQDTGINNIPYFYQIFSLAEGQEYGNSDDFILGTMTDLSADVYEDNDDYTLLTGENTVTFPGLNEAHKALIYIFPESSSGQVFTDTDYYKYRGTMNDRIYFQVRLKSGSELIRKSESGNTGYLRFNYIYRGQQSADYIVLTEDIWTELYVDCDFDCGNVNNEVFFKVYLDDEFQPGKNIVEEYEIRITK